MENMEYKNILQVNCRIAFRNWLIKYSASEKECWVFVKKGKPIDNLYFWYVDAVEEALCFGWIDSTNSIINGKRMQRFTPRRKNSKWTELNKERVRRLEKLGMMTDRGRVVLPDIGIESFKIDQDIEFSLKQTGVWLKFKSFPSLYQRVKAYNIAFYKNRNLKIYNRMLNHLIEETRNGRMFGEWNDYGRLINY